jgi:hypothetical protein
LPSGLPVVLGQDYQAPPHSPQRDPSPVEMSRSLDYCSGRPRAGLSRKSWQKIGLIDSPTARRKRRVPE